MIRNSKYRKTLLIIEILSVIIESKLTNHKEFDVSKKLNTSKKKGKVAKFKSIVLKGHQILSTINQAKYEKEHKEITEENKRKFQEAWEEKYGKDIKGRLPLDLFEGDK